MTAHTLICICSPLWPERPADSSFEVWRIGELHRDHVPVLFVFVSYNYSSQSDKDRESLCLRGVCTGSKGCQRIYGAIQIDLDEDRRNMLREKETVTFKCLSWYFPIHLVWYCFVYIACPVLNNLYPHLYISYMLHWYTDSSNSVRRFKEDSLCICMSCPRLLFACLQHKYTQWLCIV